MPELLLQQQPLSQEAKFHIRHPDSPAAPVLKLLLLPEGAIN
jgi:hypothetical protein